LTPAEPLKDDVRRILFWQTLRIECYFRAFYHKPPILSAEPWNVNLPTFTINSVASRTDAALATAFVAHTRLTLIMNDCYNMLDDDTTTRRIAKLELERSSKQIDDLLADWQIVRPLQPSSIALPITACPSYAISKSRIDASD